MSRNRHIVHESNKKTVQHKHRRKKNGKQPKRGPSQTNEGPIRSYSPAVSKHATNAWVPSNNKNPQIFRRLLRSKHNLSSPRRPRKERLRQQPMEHGQQKAQKSVQTNKRRPKPAELHRRLTQPHVQKNYRINKCRCDSGTIQPSNAKAYAEKNLNTTTNHLTPIFSTIHRTRSALAA
jgi:hypothetical protein